MTLKGGVAYSTYTREGEILAAGPDGRSVECWASYGTVGSWPSLFNIHASVYYHIHQCKWITTPVGENTTQTDIRSEFRLVFRYVLTTCSFSKMKLTPIAVVLIFFSRKSTIIQKLDECFFLRLNINKVSASNWMYAYNPKLSQKWKASNDSGAFQRHIQEANQYGKPTWRDHFDCKPNGVPENEVACNKH